jgi:hypothetical protein
MSLDLVGWNKNGQATVIALNLRAEMAAACMNHLSQPKYAFWHNGASQLPESVSEKAAPPTPRRVASRPLWP